MTLSIHRWERPGEPAEKVPLEKELKAQGHRTEFWVDRPGTIYRDRKHDAAATIWVLRGEVKIAVGNESDLLKDGDRITLPAQTAYTLEILGAKALLWLFGLKKN